MTDVAVPLQYNMCYHDVTLETPDNVRIKAYLMLQREDVPASAGVYQQANIYVPAKKDTKGENVEVPVDPNMSIDDLEVGLRSLDCV